MTLTVNTAPVTRYDFTIQTRAGTVPAVRYAYPISVWSRPDWSAFLEALACLQVDHFTLVADAGLPSAQVTLVYEQVGSLGTPCLLLTLEPSEQVKTMETALSLALEARRHGGGTHRSCFLALGGGLVGNVTGLAASLLVRGIKLVHLPTTLLSATDSVLSCKQGVNGKITPDLLVKNLVGTFKAPEFVVVNLAFWDTLPREEIRSGLCELIKNVLSIHPQRYEEALTLLHPEATYTTREYHTIFTWCFEAKQAVMREDAHEQGPALILEYGHTVGHALETLTGLKHGFAIGVGMLVAAHLSQRRGYVSEEDVQKHSRLLEQNGAPTTLPRDISLAALLKVIRQDNKIGYLPQREGFHAMVLLRRLGLPLTENGLPLTSVSEAELREAILAVQERL